MRENLEKSYRKQVYPEWTSHSDIFEKEMFFKFVSKIKFEPLYRQFKQIIYLT